MPKFKVESNLKHDGHLHGVDDQIELTAKQAKPLLESGVISSSATVSFSQEEIIAAIGELDSDNESLWTKDGVPQVAAIEDVLGDGITAAQRNEAWEVLSAE